MTARRIVPALAAAALVAIVAVAAAVVVAGLAGPRTATGIVVEVAATGLTDVQGFAIRTADGDTLEFRLGRLENATEFPPAHLHEHRATSVPVRVHYRDDGGQLVAYRIEDAP